MTELQTESIYCWVLLPEDGYWDLIEVREATYQIATGEMLKILLPQLLLHPPNQIIPGEITAEIDEDPPRSSELPEHAVCVKFTFDFLVSDDWSPIVGDDDSIPS